MWLYLDNSTSLQCSACGEVNDVGAVEVYLNADAVRCGQLAVTCRCGNVFSFEDFIKVGTALRKRPSLQTTRLTARDTTCRAA